MFCSVSDEDEEPPVTSPKPPRSDKKEDFTSDVLTSARKQLVVATPTTPLSPNAQEKTSVIRESIGSRSRSHGAKTRSVRRKRKVVDSSDSETENRSPRAQLQLDCSSDSDFTH